MESTTLPLIRRWTREEEAKLKSLREKGLTFTQIGNQLGRSKSACISCYQKLTKVRIGRTYDPARKSIA